MMVFFSIQLVMTGIASALLCASMTGGSNKLLAVAVVLYFAVIVMGQAMDSTPGEIE